MLNALVSLLYPKTCPGCDNAVPQEDLLLCTACLHGLPYAQHHLNPENETAKKFYGRIPIEYAASHLYFHKDGIVQHLIHKLKYKRREDIGTETGRWFAAELKTVDALNDVTDVIPVPPHPKKLKERGYNQVAAFAQAIAGGLGATYNDTTLLRTTYTKTQTKKNLEARAAIIGEAFDVKFTDEHHNKHFLLVDDVITTGATLESCGRALLKIPGARLSIATIAYAQT